MELNTCLEKLGHFRGALDYRTSEGCWGELSEMSLRYLGEASLLRIAGPWDLLLSTRPLL